MREISKKHKKKKAASGGKRPVSLKVSINITEGDADNLVKKYCYYRDEVPCADYM